MIVQEKAIGLKDGRAAALRTPGAADAAALLQYAKTSFGETEFFDALSQSFAFTPEQERDWIEQSRNSPNTALLALLCGRTAGRKRADRLYAAAQDPPPRHGLAGGAAGILGAGHWLGAV